LVKAEKLKTEMLKEETMETKQLNKVRNMKGSRPGGGSAGRANGNHVEKRAAAPASPFTGFGDVGRACDRWLMKNDPLFRQAREKRLAEDFQRQGRRLAEADRSES
jgi:hypothetical protein